MNRRAHFRTEIDGLPIHFVHEKGRGSAPVPVLLCHGWPWSFRNYNKVIGPLTDPAAHGGDPADAFDVIVPSPPGFAFSTPLEAPGINWWKTADLWLRLMKMLGFTRFGAAGGDVGSFIAAQLGHKHAEALIGVHLPTAGPLTSYNVGTDMLKITREGSILWCRIDRPAARNALTPAMYFGIKRAIRLINSFAEPCALIITGTGDVFAPGSDLAAATSPGRARARRPDLRKPAFFRDPGSIQPVVAAVNGIRQAGDLLIAMMADVAVVSNKATFRAETAARHHRCLVRGAVPNHVSLAQARDLLLTARKFDAAEAKAMQLISRVVPHERRQAEAVRAACEILRTAPEARAQTKRMLNQ